MSTEDLLANLGWIRDLARRLVRDASLADDLTQSTCLAALEQGPSEASKLRAWLGAVLRNFARQAARSEGARTRRESAVAREECDQSTHDTFERATLQHELSAAVLRLDEVYRTTILMRYFDGLPQREIARRLDIPTATVNSRLTRAHAKLRAELDRTHGDRKTWLAALVSIAAPPEAAALHPSWGVVLMNAKWKVTAAAIAVVSVLTFSFWPQHTTEAGPPAVAANAAQDGGGRSARGSGNGAATPDAARAHRSEVAAAKNAAQPAEAIAVKGRVLDARGVPIAGIPLGFAQDPAGDEPRATSDARGEFAFSCANPGTRIVTRNEDHVTVLEGAFSRNSPIDPLVVVAPAVRIAGFVTDSDGAPIADAYLSYRLPEDFELRLGTVLDKTRRVHWEIASMTNGAFDFTALPAVDGATIHAVRDPFASTVITAPNHSDPAVAIVMHRASHTDRVLRGRVLDALGGAVARARVGLGLTSTATDANGDFEISMRRAGAPTKLVAVTKGFLPATFEPPRDADGEPDWPGFVEVRLPGESLSICGRVLDATGKPIDGALVWPLDPTMFGIAGMMPLQIEFLSAGGILPRHALRYPPAADNPLEGNGTFSHMNRANAPSAGWFYVETDADGRFELPGLMQRGHRLRAMVPGELASVYSREIAAGSSGVDLVVPNEGNDAEIAGRIVTRSGRPVADTHVLLVGRVFSVETRVPGGDLHGTLIKHGPSTTTDADGSFELIGVPTRDVTISIYGDGIIPRVFAIDERADFGALEVEVDARVHFEFVLEDATRADTILARDADGQTLLLYRIRSGSTNTHTHFGLTEGRSGVLSVSDRITQLVLYKNGGIVEEVPVQLDGVEKTVIRR